MALLICFWEEGLSPGIMEKFPVSRLSFLIFCLLTVPVFGQFDTGTISGSVKDGSGASVAGAAVTVTHDATGGTQRLTSNHEGYFSAPLLPVGNYRISVEAAGFKRFVQTGIILNSSGKVNIDAELTVGQVTESVEVTSSAAQVQTESAQVGRVVESKQIQDLTLKRLFTI